MKTISRFGFLIALFTINLAQGADSATLWLNVKTCGMDYRDSSPPKVFVILENNENYHRIFSKDILSELNVANSIYSTCLTAYSTTAKVQLIVDGSSIKFIQIGN